MVSIKHISQWVCSALSICYDIRECLLVSLYFAVAVLFQSRISPGFQSSGVEMVFYCVCVGAWWCVWSFSKASGTVFIGIGSANAIDKTCYRKDPKQTNGKPLKDDDCRGDMRISCPRIFCLRLVKWFVQGRINEKWLRMSCLLPKENQGGEMFEKYLLASIWLSGSLNKVSGYYPLTNEGLSWGRTASCNCTAINTRSTCIKIQVALKRTSCNEWHQYNT